MTEPMESRSVTLDFVAVCVVGLILALLLAVSITLTVASHQARSDEHERIDRKVTAICRAIPECKEQTNG